MVNVARRVFFYLPASQVLLNSRPEKPCFYRGYLGAECGEEPGQLQTPRRQYCRPALETRYWPTGLGAVTSKAKRKRGRSSPG